MSDQSVEFRVIQGMQAGASLPLGQRTYVVGASKDCDIVVSGSSIAPEHASIAVSGNNFAIEPREGTITILGEGDIRERTVLSFGQMFRLGVGTCATVVPILTPWQSSDDIASQERGLMPVKAFEEDSQVQAYESLPYVLELFDFFRKHKILTATLMVCLVMLGGSFIGYHYVQKKFFPAPARIVYLNPLTDAQVEQAIAQAFEKAQVKTKLEVKKEHDRYFLTAYVPDQKAYVSVVDSLNAIAAPISAQIYVDQSIRDSAFSYVAKLSARLMATYQGMGQLRVEGVMIPAHWQNSIKRLEESIPGLKKVVVHSTSLDFVINNMVTELGYQGLARAIILTPNGDSTIQAEGQLEPTQVRAWRQVAEKFTHRYRVSIDDHGITTLAKLPFKVRSVVGGSTPFIMTSTGEKMIVGATRYGVKLVGVDEQRGAIFEQDGVRVLVSHDSA